MAAGGQMAEFFATLGFKINKGDIQKVDKVLDHVEKRAKQLAEGSLNNIKVNISGFRFSEGFNAKLYKSLQKKMTLVNNKKGLSPEITVSKFNIDKSALLREMREAVEYVENNLRVNLRAGVQRGALGLPTTASGGLFGSAGGVSRFGAGMGLGAAAGSLGRGFIPGLGVAFSISQMNRLNQQLIGQELAATAVFGSEEAGQEQLDWLRKLGNQIGFDYRSQANAYMKMAAAGTTAGMGTGQVQEIFKSMAEYGRVMGLNDEDMKGSMRAVEQMLNKGQVYAEELKMQLGEKFPAAIQLMAEAVSGGDTEKLFDMMEKGEVKSLEALPKFAEILSRQARVGGALEEAMRTSLAEQMRFNNTFNDLLRELSDAGFEEGQAGIFRVMRTFFSEMKPLLYGFGEAWVYVQDVLRVPLGLLADLGTGIEKLSNETGLAKGKIVAFGGYISALLFPFTRTITLIGTALAVLEDFTAFLSGRGSVIGHFVKQFEESNPTEYIKTVKELKSAFEGVSEVIEVILFGWGKLLDLFASKDFSSGALNLLRVAAAEVGATAEALLRIMRAMGYKDPDETEEDRLRRIQERAERPKTPMEIATERLKNMLRDPLSMIGLGKNSESLEDYGRKLESLSDPNRNPFLMNDEAVRQSYFAESQIMRIGGGQQTFAAPIIGQINIEGYRVQNPEELAEAIKKEFDEHMRRVSDKVGSSSQ